MDTEIEEVKQKISEVEQKISEVEQQIKDVEGQLTKAVTEADVAYWRKEKEQLRKEKEQLRKEKEQLRKEKEQLRNSSLFCLQAEGEPPSRKEKRSRDEYLSSDAVDRVESKVAARSCYFKKLLEAPLELPKSTEELRIFLATRTEKLPLVNEEKYSEINQPDLVRLCTSAAESTLARFLDSAFDFMSGPCPGNEATSSSELYFITGHFLKHLNKYAPEDRQLICLDCLLDSPNPRTSKTASNALLPLLRPDFQLFVSDVLMLRWENKIDVGDIMEALEENVSKLKVWSPLYYGTLPYVIGGCCAGRQFRWLKLSPNGERIVAEIISDVYDLNMSSGVAKFLHSTIRMHCLLQKLQGELGDHIPLKLYNILRRNGGEVVVYPDFVHKVVRPPLEEKKLGMFRSLYASLKGSRYLIQLRHCRALRGETQLQLEPVGDPHARPGVLKDLAAAVHDILHGLADLHKQGYTHRDLRWENCIKVNVQGEWKWVIIDLEAAGLDGEEWEGDGLTTWDERTLEDRNGKRIYTKGSDMYQLGKLIVEWFDRNSTCGEEVQDLYRMGENMQRERPAATTMLEEICKSGCQRCGKLDRASLNSGRHNRKASRS